MRRVPRHRAQRKCHPFECRTWFLGTESGDDHARHIQFDRAGGCAPSQPSLSPSHARLETVCRYRRARVVSTRFPALTPCHHRALPPGSQEKFLSARSFVFSNSPRCSKPSGSFFFVIPARAVSSTCQPASVHGKEMSVHIIAGG